MELFDNLLQALHHNFGCCKHCWLQHKAAENTLLPIHYIVVRVTRAHPYSHNIHIGWFHTGPPPFIQEIFLKDTNFFSASLNKKIEKS